MTEAEQAIVYLVEEGEYVDRWPVAAFTTHDDAEEYVAYRYVKGSVAGGGLHISEVPLDAPTPDFPRDRQLWEVDFRNPDRVRVTRQESTLGCQETRVIRHTWIWSAREPWYSVWCCAPDRESAIRIATEQKTRSEIQ